MITYTNESLLEKWDQRFLHLARMEIAEWSKGPRKRVGAVLVRPCRSIASAGYNGPPRGFDDKLFLAMSREEQHAIVVHAEINAIKQLNEYESANGYTLYVAPMFPCERCAYEIVKAGISKVVAYCGQEISADWQQSAKKAEQVFINAAVNCIYTFGA